MAFYHCTVGGGAPTGLTEVYNLTAPAQWETFTNPNSVQPLIVKCEYEDTTLTFPAVKEYSYEVNLSDLPDLSQGGDPYITIGLGLAGEQINMRTDNNNNLIYISTGSAFAGGEEIKVYKQD